MPFVNSVLTIGLSNNGKILLAPVVNWEWYKFEKIFASKGKQMLLVKGGYGQQIAARK